MPCGNEWHINNNIVNQMLYLHNYTMHGTTASHPRDVARKLETSHVRGLDPQMMGNDQSMF